MIRPSTVGGACIGLGLLAALPAYAEEPRGCDKFAWPLDQEAAALSAAALPAVKGGVSRTVSPEAFTLMLAPLADAALPKMPERTPRNAQSFAGFVTYAAPPAKGPYQVTLSAAAWIDVIQGGHTLKPSAFSGAMDCPGVRKSVRFDLDVAPFTLQVSDVQGASIGLIVARLLVSVPTAQPR